MFATLKTVEPPIVDREVAEYLESEETWCSFSAGDLLMVTVLRRLNSSRALEEFPNLRASVVRGEVRHAYQRAFEAQLAVFKAATTE
jgi:glutathione S-transferase